MWCFGVVRGLDFDLSSTCVLAQLQPYHHRRLLFRLYRDDMDNLKQYVYRFSQLWALVQISQISTKQITTHGPNPFSAED